MATLQKKVIQLNVTSVTAGAFYETSIPDGLGGYLSRRIAHSALASAINSAGETNKGYFTTEAALVAEYPAGENGWYAIVGATDTVWLWDGDANQWVDSTVTSAVVSVNGATGVVVLDAEDIGFTSLQGIVASNTRDAVDELKVYVEGLIAGAGGLYIADYRNGQASVVVGSNEITFEDSESSPIPFIDAAYTLIIDDISGCGIDKENATLAAGSFTVDALSAGTINYLAVRTTSTLNELLTEGTPASAAATGTKGTMQYDANYLYICVATDTWIRIAKSAW